MSIYLGGSKLQLNLGGTGIGEAYLGGVKVLGGGIPALAPNSLRLQFDDASYDPTVGVWGNGTILDYGWTAIKRASNIWDIRHDGASLHDTTTPFSTAGSNPPTQPWRVLEVNKNPAWNDYWALFGRQPYLEYVPLFEIAGTEEFGTMFFEDSRLTNSVEWAKHIATHLQGYNTNQTFTSCANAASIPTDFGGTKGRTRIVIKAGGANVSESLTITLRPGDWVYTSCRGYQSTNTSLKLSTCYLSLPPSSGTAMANNSQYSSTYLIYAKASGRTGTKVTDETTIRWGYAEGTRMTCTGYRASYNTNNPYANLYVDSFQFI